MVPTGDMIQAPGMQITRLRLSCNWSWEAGGREGTWPGGRGRGVDSEAQHGPQARSESA